MPCRLLLLAASAGTERLSPSRQPTQGAQAPASRASGGWQPLGPAFHRGCAQPGQPPRRLVGWGLGRAAMTVQPLAEPS